MQLYETPMGRKLIERDIPRIADALERIASQLENKNNQDIICVSSEPCSTCTDFGKCKLKKRRSI